MNSTITNSSRAVEVQALSPQNDSSRCRYRSSNGKRCRLPGLESQSGLCSRHFLPTVATVPHSPGDSADLSPAFPDLLSGFHSAVSIHAFLTQVTVLLVQNRVSTRRAAILAYLGQILLRNLSAINHEQKDKDKAGEDTDGIAVLPPHLQEMILYKRRIAAEAYAKSRSGQTDSQSVGAAFRGGPPSGQAGDNARSGKFTSPGDEKEL
jgi:hypothetical protein